MSSQLSFLSENDMKQYEDLVLRIADWEEKH